MGFQNWENYPRSRKPQKASGKIIRSWRRDIANLSVSGSGLIYRSGQWPEEWPALLPKSCPNIRAEHSHQKQNPPKQLRGPHNDVISLYFLWFFSMVPFCWLSLKCAWSFWAIGKEHRKGEWGGGRRQQNSLHQSLNAVGVPSEAYCWKEY